jgi:hypothetical protein
MLSSLGFVVLCCLLTCLIACGAVGDESSAPAAPSDPRWDDYQVIMWVLHGIPGDGDLFFQRLREANVNGIQVATWESPEPALSRGFEFYVENVHRIAFLHEREPIYKADWDAYTKTRDKQHLLRDPCLHDESYLASAKQDIQDKVRRFADHNPLMYDLGDECSITSFASPMDYCFAEPTLKAFREWLMEHYGDLDRLNEQWESDFSSWEDVVPITTYEMKDRERTGSENYSPWADHRTFMDVTFAESWRTFRSWLREIDPDGLAGLAGLQMPATFGGYDLWRLSQVLDWFEPYDIGESRGIFRSFLPEGTPVFATLFEHDPNQASRRLWHVLLNGDRGVIIWCSSDWFDYESPDITPKPFVAGMGEVFAELRGPAAKAIMHAKRDRPPIAIHYSHPSIQVGWMIDSREDLDTWPRRFSSYEAVHSRITRVRDSWCRMLEDLGYQYDFVSTDQILDGTLAERGYEVLILPQSMAVREEEAEAIERYANDGGVVVADFFCGIFDGHAKRREAGILDSFFGISRDAQTGMVAQPEQSHADDGQLRAAEPELLTEKGEAVSRLRRKVGKGAAVYLNLTPIDYSKLRLEGKGDDIRAIAAETLADAGLAPPAEVTIDGGPPVGCEVLTYEGDGRRYIAIMRRPEYSIGSLGEIGYSDNSRFEKPVDVTARFGEKTRATELLSGLDLGETEETTLTLRPWKPLILELQ